MPLRSELPFAFSVSKLPKLPKLEGRAPLNVLPLSTNDVKDTSFPIDEDIDPTTPLEDRSTALTCRPEQDTPLQPQTTLSGMEPVQDHPTIVLKDFVFVAAATSHIAASFSVAVGAAVGGTVGFGEGAPLGCSEGCPDGCPEGCPEGCAEGISLGSPDG